MLAAPPHSARIADRYIAPTDADDEAVPTRVYVLAGGSNMDGRANAAELTAVSLERIQNASKRVRLVYIGGLSEMAGVPTSRYEGPLTTVVPNDILCFPQTCKFAAGAVCKFGKFRPSLHTATVSEDAVPQATYAY